MKMNYVAYKWLLMAMVQLSLFGCGLLPIVQIGSLATSGTSEVSETIPVGNVNMDYVFECALEVGRSMGYKGYVNNFGSDHYGRDYSYSLKLTVDTSFMSGLITGHQKTVHITVESFKIFPKRFEPLHDEILVTVWVLGDFGSGWEASARKVLRTFKGKLLDKLRQKG